MPNIIPSMSAPLVSSTNLSGNKPIRWGGSPSFNFERGEFNITPTGQIVMLNEAQSFIQWFRKSLITHRFRHKIYWFRSNAGFGSEFPNMIGKPYHDAIKESLAIRFSREAVQFDSRIRSIPKISAILLADTMTVVINIINVSGMELQFRQIWTVK